MQRSSELVAWCVMSFSITISHRTNVPAPPMTRTELVQQLALKFPLLMARDIDQSVRAILGEMARTLTNGGRVEIRGFGSFNLNYRPQRRGRNPKTGTAVMVPARYVPRFKPGKELRERVDEV